MRTGRVAGLVCIIFFCLVAVEVVVLAAVAGRLPNMLSVPLAKQFSLLTLLWQSNPAAALPLIAQTPVFVIAHQEPADSLQTWGLYFFPLTLIVHLAVTVVAAQYLRRPMRDQHQRWWLLAGGATLVFAVTYTRVATCCTGGPRWVLDLGLYALAFDPTPSLLDWSAIYLRMEAILPFLQFATGAAGIACILTATRQFKRPD